MPPSSRRVRRTYHTTARPGPNVHSVVGTKHLSARPPAPAQILLSTALRVSLWMEGLRTRVLRGVELKNHPLRVRNARIGRRVQKPHIFVRKLKLNRADVIFQLLRLSRSDDHAADRRPLQHP